jgi:3-oxoadipate CoA-transferase beta subunit
MDLAVGAKRSVVMMTLLTKDGRLKLVPECTLPLTGVHCVSRVDSDLTVIDVVPALSADGGARVVETDGVPHR